MKLQWVTFVLWVNFATTLVGNAAPATNPSSPKNVIRVVFGAIRRGDAPTALSNSVNGDPKIITSMCALTLAMIQCHEAAVTKFGEAGNIVFSDVMGDSALEADDVDVQVVEDSAIVTSKKNDMLVLKNINGNWKVDFSSFPHAADVMRSGPELQLLIAAIGKSADGIAAGKYETPIAARQAIKMNIAEALGGRPPTTQKAE